MPNNNTHTDQQLFNRLKNGDQEAFATIYDRYFSLLFIHADTKLQDDDKARDVVQDVFVRLWEKRDSLEVNNSLSGYLYQSVRNQIFDLMKHQKVADKYTESFFAAGMHSEIYADHLIRQKQFSAMIDAEISALPPRMRQVFMLRRKENLSNREVAELLNITESTAADQMKKALKILRIRIGLVLALAAFADQTL